MPIHCYSVYIFCTSTPLVLIGTALLYITKNFALYVVFCCISLCFVPPLNSFARCRFSAEMAFVDVCDSYQFVLQNNSSVVQLYEVPNVNFYIVIVGSRCPNIFTAKQYPDIFTNYFLRTLLGYNYILL